MQAAKSHAMEFLPALGNYLIMAMLATCLFLDIPIGGIFIAYMSALALLSGFASVWQSVGNFDRNFVRSDIGRYYLVVSMLTVVCILLSIHHGETGELEIALKRFFIAYVVVNLVWRYSVDTVLVGTAVGALRCLRGRARRHIPARPAQGGRADEFRPLRNDGRPFQRDFDRRLHGGR